MQSLYPTPTPTPTPTTTPTSNSLSAPQFAWEPPWRDDRSEQT